MATEDEDMLLRLQSTIESWSSEVTDAQVHLTHQIGETREQLASLSKVLASRSQKRSTLIDTFNELQDLKKLLTQRDQEIETAQDENATLECEINMFQRDIDELRSKDRSKAESLESLNHELAEVLDREGVSANSLGQLREEVQSLQERLADREAAMNTDSQAINALKEESTALHVERDQLRANAGEAAKTEAALHHQINSLSAELESARREAGLSKEEAEAAREQASTQALERETVSANALGQLREEVQSLQERLADREATLSMASQFIDALKEESTTLHVERDQLRADAGEAAKTEAALHHQINSLSAELESARREAGLSKEEAEAAREQTSTQALERESISAELQKMRNQRAEHEAALAHSQTEARNLQQDLQEKRRNQQAQEDKLKALGQEAEQQAESLSAAEGENGALREQIKDLATHQDQLRDRAEASRKEIEGLREALEAQGVTLLDLKAKAALQGVSEQKLLNELALLKKQENDWLKSEKELSTHLEEARQQIALLEVDQGPHRAKVEDTGEERSPEQDRHGRAPFAAFDANGRRRTMGEILLNSELITLKQLESALEEQRSAKHRRLGTILVEKGLTTEQTVTHVLASQLDLAFIQVPEETIEASAVRLLTGTMATHHLCLPIRVSEGEMTVAMANPLDSAAIDAIETATGLAAKPVVATPADITAGIVRHYGVNASQAAQEHNAAEDTPQARQSA